MAASELDHDEMLKNTKQNLKNTEYAEFPICGSVGNSSEISSKVHVRSSWRLNVSLDLLRPQTRDPNETPPLKPAFKSLKRHEAHGAPWGPLIHSSYGVSERLLGCPQSLLNHGQALNTRLVQASLEKVGLGSRGVWGSDFHDMSSVHIFLSIFQQ